MSEIKLIRPSEYWIENDCGGMMKLGCDYAEDIITLDIDGSINGHFWFYRKDAEKIVALILEMAGKK